MTDPTPDWLGGAARAGGPCTLRSVVGKQVGVASSGRLDDEGLRRLVESAGAIARNVAELDDWAGLPEPNGPPVAQRSVMFAGATEASSPEQRADGVRAVIAAADEAGVIAYGSFATNVERMAIANSRGIR